MVKKYIINTILIILILVIVVCIVKEKIEENNIKENSYEIKNLNSLIEDNNTKTEENENENETKITQYPKEEILDTYKGYQVCAKLEIPSIYLEINVLTNYSKQALKVSVTKFWGVNPNQIGNFCIAGHNYKNMFINLKKLEIGDELFVTDKIIGKVKYEIFKIEKVLPEDTSCLDAVTNNEREVTLITCTSDTEKRIIIKAKEK